MRIAVLRCARLPSFVTWEIPDVESLFGDDRGLLDALAERGVDAEPVAWTDQDADWDAYDAAVLRSTWDYVDHLPRFLEVTATIDRSRCTLSIRRTRCAGTPTSTTSTTSNGWACRSCRWCVERPPTRPRSARRSPKRAGTSSC